VKSIGAAMAAGYAYQARQRANMMRCERDDVEWFGATEPCWVCGQAGVLIYQAPQPMYEVTKSA